MSPSSKTAFARARRRANGTWWQSAAPAAVDLNSVLSAFGQRRDLDCDDHTSAEIDLDRIVGTLARSGDFDRQLNPRAGHLRERWTSVHHARQQGIDLGCVTLIRVGDLYLVDDGHHRVSVARALGQPAIPACIRRVCTARHACLACLEHP